MITCPKCNKELSEGTKFCDNCGSQIFETIFCPNCGQKTSTEFAFCQSCGASILEDTTPEAPLVIEAPQNNGTQISCPNCGKKLPEGTQFCDGCGSKIFEIIFCPNCGQKTSTEFAFCQNCGASITNSLVPTDTKVKPKKPIPKKAFLFGGIGLVAVLLLVFIASLFLKGGGDKPYGLYLRDGEVFYSELSKKEPLEITSKLANGEYVSDAEMAYAADTLGSYITFSEDGKRIFYPDRLGSDSDGITLYCRNMKKPKQEPIRIDSDVMLYTVNQAGNCVTYLKGYDGILYQHNLEEKEKIASDVMSFQVSEDGKKIGYYNEDGYYIWRAGKDTNKLASDISSLVYVSEDISVIYYIKEGGLYRQADDGSDKEKIASDVSRVVTVYDSGEIYYTKAENTQKPLMDYVEDDMAASDSIMLEPERPEYPSYWDFETTDEYNAAVKQYELAYQVYEQDKQVYQEKVQRDRMREELNQMTMDETAYLLYFYNGTEESLVTDGLSDEYDVTYAADSPVLTLPVYNQSETPQIKLSKLENTYQVYDLVQEALYSVSERYLAVKNELTVIDQIQAQAFRITPAGDAVYFLDEVAEDGYGDLYKMEISSKSINSPSLYDSEVYNSSLYFVSGDKLIYYKNVDNDSRKGDLFLDQKEIDYDVSLYSVSYSEDSGSLLYYTDWNSERSYGTLKTSKNGKSTKIADDVHQFLSLDNGDVLYLYDYSSNYYKGTLYLYRKGKAQKLDDDVVAIIPINDSKMRGEYYYGW
ncbi:MAG: zinc ribbon domain-containing protein [Lachnospiraceae bacterium]|nr:zinc ribbon domain-containing protein [Lachnospiraceae bacterium]